MAVEYQYPAEPPAQCGKRLVPVLIDEIAKADPNRTFISSARGATAAEGYVDISYRAFATAVNRCAWHLEGQVGLSQTDATVFYIGPLDVRYLVIWMAALKTGYIVSRQSVRGSNVGSDASVGIL
jgi:acyl-CoA synthetase (AMP-forming)/AMP-acid ligase II